jgi:hypothetical protein
MIAAYRESPTATNAATLVSALFPFQSFATRREWAAIVADAAENAYREWLREKWETFSPAIPSDAMDNPPIEPLYRVAEGKIVDRLGHPPTDPNEWFIDEIDKAEKRVASLKWDAESNESGSRRLAARAEDCRARAERLRAMHAVAVETLAEMRATK